MPQGTHQDTASHAASPLSSETSHLRPLLRNEAPRIQNEDDNVSVISPVRMGTPLEGLERGDEAPREERYRESTFMHESTTQEEYSNHGQPTMHKSDLRIDASPQHSSPHPPPNSHPPSDPHIPFKNKKRPHPILINDTAETTKSRKTPHSPNRQLNSDNDSDNDDDDDTNTTNDNIIHEDDISPVLEPEENEYFNPAPQPSTRDIRLSNVLREAAHAQQKASSPLVMDGDTSSLATPPTHPSKQRSHLQSVLQQEFHPNNPTVVLTPSANHPFSHHHSPPLPATFGLTTKLAIEILSREIKHLFSSLSVDRFSWVYKSIFELGVWHLWLFIGMHICCLLMLAALVMRWVQYGQQIAWGQTLTRTVMSNVRVTLEFLLIILSLLVYDVIILIESWKKHRGTIYTMRKKVRRFLQHAETFDIGDSYRYDLDSMHSVAVFRDGRWTRLPYSLLVKGDVLYSRFPHQHFEHHNMEFEMVPNLAHCYILKSSALPKLIQQSLPPIAQEMRRPVHMAVRLFAKPFAFMLAVTLCIVLLVNGIRVLTNSSNYSWVNLLFLEPVYYSMFLLPVGFPVIWIVIHVIAKATLVGLQTVLMQMDYLEEINPKNKHKIIPIPKSLFLRLFVQFAVRFIDPALDDIFHLGSIRNLCCVDADGILAYPNYVPTQIFMVQTVELDYSMMQSGVIGVASSQTIDDSAAEYGGVEGGAHVAPAGESDEDALIQYSHRTAEERNTIKYVKHIHIGHSGGQHVKYNQSPGGNHHSPGNGDTQQAGHQQPGHQQAGHQQPGHQHHHHHHHHHQDAPSQLTAASHHHHHHHHHHHTHESTPVTPNLETTTPDLLQDDQSHYHQLPEEDPSATISMRNPAQSGDDDADYSDMESQSTSLAKNLRPEGLLLDLLCDNITNDVTFEDQNWEEYLTLLKAMGFSFLISSQMMPDHDLNPIDDDRSFLWKPHLYKIAKLIGFEDDVLHRVTPKMKITTRRQQAHIVGRVINFEGAGLQLHSYGDPAVLLDYCIDYFDGIDIRPVTKEVKKQLLKKHSDWTEKKNYVVVAFSYKPLDSKVKPLVNSNLHKSIIIEEDYVVDESSDEYQFLQMQQSQIFLGMVAFQRRSFSYLTDYFQNLSEDAGIRFSYFSETNLFATKAFGQNLGLESTWNSCISLSDPTKPVELDAFYKNARLPVGIEAIQKHIREVDDVPLRVSLFCDVTPTAIRQMIDLLQRNDEIVCCVGSSTTAKNLPLFTQADISVAIDPYVPRAADYSFTSRYESVKQITTAPCSFHIQEKSSRFAFLIIFHLIKECRRQVSNIQQSFLFLMGANMCLYLIQILGGIFVLPPMVNGLQAFWMMLVIIPLFSLALMSNAAHPQVMNLITLKNAEKRSVKEIVGVLVEIFLRFVIPIPLCIVLNVWTVLSMPGVSKQNVGVLTFWFGQLKQGVYDSPEYELAMLYGQNFMLFYLIIHFCFISVGFLSDLHSLITVRLWSNWSLLAVMPLSLVLQVLFTMVQIGLQRSIMSGADLFPSLPWYFYVIFVFFPAMNLVYPEWIKRRKRKRFAEAQLKEKLLFETRLGMWSPK